MKKQFEFQNRFHEVWSQKVSGKYWIHFAGQTFVVDPNEGKSFHKTKGGAASPGQILSPMPGKVTKIFVKAGDSIKAGSPVIVMEAMKMEYTLKADMDGQVSEINAILNEQVVLGKTLVKIV